MKRFEIALVIGIIFAVLVSSFTAFAQSCEEVRDEVLRIHVLANSNTDEDQQLKLDVRDTVLLGTQEMFIASSTKMEVEELAAEHLEDIRSIAQREVDRQGYDYQVQVSLVNMFFDTRTYGDVTLPAGRYDAVRVTIGEGAGNNWWCVMFPPMCIPAASESDGKDVEEQISRLGQTPQYEAKFAVVELVESIWDKD